MPSSSSSDIAELKQVSCESKLTRIDLLVAPVIALTGAFWMFTFIGTAVNWDDLLYLDLALHPFSYPEILNRFGHIYILKFFLFLTGDSILSGEIYWLTVFWGTGLLVYWSARLLACGKNYLVGIVAALLFYIQPIFAKEFGCPLADFTVMFLMMLGVFVSLLFLYNSKSHKCLLMLLGLICFWIVKSKETGIALGILIIGLGSIRNDRWNFRVLIRNLGWVLAGVATGGIAFTILDAIFLKDPVFWLRLSAISRVLEYNINKPAPLRPLTKSREVMSWYAGIAKSPYLVALFAPFMLYLFEGVKQTNRKYKIFEKFIWLIPLGLLVFLTYVRSRFWVLPRYFLPVVPLICVWSAQVFGFSLSELFFGSKIKQRSRQIIISFLIVLSAFIVACILMSFVPRLSEFYNFMRYDILKFYFKTNENVFYAVGIVPLMVTIFIVMFAFTSKRNLVFLFGSFFCLFMLIYHPLRTNHSAMLATAERSQWRFLPLKVFADDFEFNDDTKILVSGDIHNRSWMLGNSLRKQRWFFNICFNKKYTNDNFIYADNIEDIIKSDYTYGLISAWDWQNINEQYPDEAERLNSRYILRMETVGGQMPIILLKKR